MNEFVVNKLKILPITRNVHPSHSQGSLKWRNLQSGTGRLIRVIIAVICRVGIFIWIVDGWSGGLWMVMVCCFYGLKKWKWKAKIAVFIGVISWWWWWRGWEDEVGKRRGVRLPFPRQGVQSPRVVAASINLGIGRQVSQDSGQVRSQVHPNPKSIFLRAAMNEDGRWICVWGINWRANLVGEKHKIS